MKKLQNTLYINTEGVYLHKENETLVVDGKDEENKQVRLLKLPIHAISNIFCFGNIMVSPQLLGFCGEKGVQLSFFDRNGQFQARVIGRQQGNVVLRIEQMKYAFSGDLRVVKNIVAAKIKSSRNVLLRQIRTYGEAQDLKQAAESMKLAFNKIKTLETKDLLRGTEGEAAKEYFGVFNSLIRNESFTFNNRNRRPPKDPVNSLLSLLYSVYAKEISGALQGVGLDPQIGFYHEPRSGRDSLALDLLEEFRAPIIDRFVLSLINRGQVEPKDFNLDSIGGVFLTTEGRKKVFEQWQAKKLEIIEHPFLHEKIPIGLLPHVQSMLLAKFLRHDLDNYPPFISR